MEYQPKKKNNNKNNLSQKQKQALKIYRKLETEL